MTTEPGWLDEIEGTLRRARRDGSLRGAAGTDDTLGEELRWLAEQAEGRVLLVVDGVVPDDGAFGAGTTVHDLTSVAAEGDGGPETPRLPLGDDAADTVLLHAVLETAVEPGRLVEEVARVLDPGGHVAIVARLGLNDDPWHRRTLYPSTVVELVSGPIGITALTVDEGVMRIRGELRGDLREADTPDPMHLLATVEAELELALRRAELDRERWRAEAERRHARLEELRRADARREILLERAKRRLDRAREQRDEARRARKATERRLTKRVRKLERRVDKLEADRRTLRERVAAEREKRERMRQRRWWRLGELLAAARRSPRKLLRLPLDVLRLLRDRG